MKRMINSDAIVALTDVVDEVNGLKDGSKGFASLVVWGEADIGTGIIRNPWIEATLLNGYTGHLYYRLTKIRQVEYAGVVTAPAVLTGQTMAILPTGYLALNYQIHAGLDETTTSLIHVLVYPTGKLDLFETAVAEHTYQFGGNIVV